MVENKLLLDLKQFEVFSGIPITILQKYNPYFYFRTYKKNQYLFIEGDPRDKIYFLLEGYVMYERDSAEGSMIYIDFLKSRQMFPYIGLFKDETYHDSAQAMTDIRVYFIPTSLLEDLLCKQAKQLIHIISKLSDLLVLHQKRMERIIVPNAHDRVLRSLQFLMEDLGEADGDEVKIHCPLTEAMIAKFSGTSRETVCIIMNQLKRNGTLSVEAKKIRIHQPSFFTEFSKESISGSAT